MDRIHFDDFEIDLARREIRHRGRPVAADRQVFEVVAYLAANADRVVSRTELLDEVWGDRFVSDSALSTRIKTARQVLGDDGRRQRRIVTVRGVGYRLVLDGDPTGGGVATAGVGGGELPTPADELIGREHEVEAIERLISAGRSVTLTGPGGVGKTRIALEVARRRQERHRDGCRLVELAAIGAGTDIAPLVATVLELRLPADEPQAEMIALALRGRELLLVLDNCEHVLDGALALMVAIGRRSPTVVMLATSRSPVGHPGEHLVPVPPLATASAHVETGPRPPAEQLLARRLAAIAPGVVPDGPLVTSICRRLDGVPLALELAAGRARTLGLDVVHDRLGDGLGLLEGRGGATRHRSLRDSIGWSYELLSPLARLVLGRASVFAGPFELTAAESVLPGDGLDRADVLAGLVELADASLVQTGRGRPGRHRFGLLETIRQFAQEKVGDGERVVLGRRLVSYMVGVAAEAEQGALGPDPARWFAQLDADLANLREAARLAVADGDDQAALDMAWSLREWSYLTLVDEPMAWADGVRRRVGPDHDLYPKALGIAGYQLATRGRRDALIAELESVEGRAGDEPWVPRALTLLYLFDGRYADASIRCERVVELWDRRGDHANRTYQICMWSMVLGAVDPRQARRLGAEALASAARLDSPVLRASGLLVTAATLIHDQPARAWELVDELLPLSRSLGDRWHLANALRFRSNLLSRNGRLVEADRSFVEALHVNGFSDRAEYLWFTVLNLLAHLVRRGSPVEAAVALGAHRASQAAIQAGRPGEALDRIEAELDRRLGVDERRRREAEGADLPVAGLLDRLVSVLDG